LLELTRPHDGQEAFDRTFALLAARAEHDFPPLHCDPMVNERSCVRPA
jgi:hypothetical protein